VSGYSQDLRERVITAWQNGKRQAWIAETFQISVSSIKRYISRFRQTGSVAPTIQQREQPLIKAEQAPAVQAMVDECPDATLDEYCEDWEKRTGQRVSDSTMSRALMRFDRPRKKRQSAPPSAMRRSDGTGGK
jgi:putative transposase